MNRNKLLLYVVGAMVFIALVAMSFTIHNLNSKLGLNSSQLKKKDREYANTIRELQKQRKRYELREAYWQTVQVKLRDSVKVFEKKTTAWKYRYENIKNTPPPLWTNAELDSLIARLIHN